MVCIDVVWCVDRLGCGLEWCDVMCGSVVVCSMDVVWIGMMWCGVVRYWFVCGGWLMHNGTYLAC